MRSISARSGPVPFVVGGVVAGREHEHAGSGAPATYYRGEADYGRQRYKIR